MSTQMAQKGSHTMTGRAKAAVLIAGLVVVAGVSSPIANARPTCQDTNTKTICQTNGSVSIKARPGTTAPPANLPVFPWLGMPGAR
jgi:hypothetical protein